MSDSIVEPENKSSLILNDRRFWVVAVPAYAAILAITILKDLHFTGNEPNIWFYILVPTVNIVASAAIVFLFSLLCKFNLPFTGILKIVFISEFIMQVWENVAKAVYYTLWEYPGILWFTIYPFALWLMAFLFVRILGTSWKLGWLLAIISFAAGLLAGMGFMSITGIETPGS